jgi:putative membrane protein
LIPRYSDHAANERTFLAWVRTGIATIAFGFVIEKFSLFLRTIANFDRPTDTSSHILGRFSGWLGRFDGTVLIFLGIALIGIAAWRFVRTSRLIEAPEEHSATNTRAELILSLVLVIAALAAHVAFD